jgi:hypothetical protein
MQALTLIPEIGVCPRIAAARHTVNTLHEALGLGAYELQLSPGRSGGDQPVNRPDERCINDRRTLVNLKKSPAEAGLKSKINPDQRSRS